MRVSATMVFALFALLVCTDAAASPLRVFVSSRATTGHIRALGPDGAEVEGVEAAQATCQQLADSDRAAEGMYGRKWAALLGASDRSAFSQLSGAAGFSKDLAYVDSNGQAVARDFDELTDKMADQAGSSIASDESGKALDVPVWTGMHADGRTALSCNSWRSENARDSGTVRDSGRTNRPAISCGESNHLYCFELPSPGSDSTESVLEEQDDDTAAFNRRHRRRGGSSGGGGGHGSSGGGGGHGGGYESDSDDEDDYDHPHRSRSNFPLAQGNLESGQILVLIAIAVTVLLLLLALCVMNNQMMMGAKSA